MEAEETEEAAEEGENEFDSDVTENEGVIEEEDRPVRGKEQEEEGDEEGEEHPEEAEHLRGQRRRSEDVTFEQSIESTSRDDRSVMEEEDWADSVESDTEDSGSSGFEEDFYNFQVINHEEEAVEKRYEHPEELEENSILAALASKERQEEKDESEMLSDEPAEESWTIEDEKGETTDDEEAEPSADEDADDNDDDVTKIYRKDDYFQLVFGTLKEFQDASLLTDLTLSTDHGKSIHVHSVVLAAVSSLIREGLSRSDVKSNGADERKDRGDHRWSVSLGPEVDQVGLEAVVEFAYTGLMSRLNKDTVHQIMAAAQTLGALRVLDLCREDEETSTKTGEQEKEERVPAAEQMAISLQSIKQLWMEKMGCDVILEALGGSLHVHRAILAAGSDYFRSMFTLGMKESYQSCVILPFLLASDLEVLICCTYSGALPLSWGCVFEITSTALQLQYQPALSLCLNFLHQEINPHCCLDVVSFAEAHEMVQLLEAADDFVLRQFQKVACTSKFKDLPAKQLLKYLNSHSLCVPSELVVFKAVVAWIEARPRIRMRLAKELMKTIQFPLMTFKEFKEVKSLNMWSNYTLTEAL
ncbi:Kelch-like protein 26 [Nibea albiflora]|uniref:Kelch-like protein 26 n=1 Tax=Nibea albiflora TaxID=240163 RepID=A0ACB7EV80_NIBAL|nr:Kelch-like protein 26 [Nibea albiflora]